MTRAEINDLFAREWASGVAALAAAFDDWHPRDCFDVWAKLRDLDARLVTLRDVLKAAYMPDEVRHTARESEKTAGRETYAIPVLWPDDLLP